MTVHLHVYIYISITSGERAVANDRQCIIVHGEESQKSKYIYILNFADHVYDILYFDFLHLLFVFVSFCTLFWQVQKSNEIYIILLVACIMHSQCILKYFQFKEIRFCQKARRKLFMSSYSYLSINILSKKEY